MKRVQRRWASLAAPQNILLWLTLSSGCAGFSAAQRGQDAMSRQDFDRAVAEYQQAVSEAPRDKEYQQKLQEAKQQRAIMWLADAHRLVREGDLNLSRARCDSILSDFPEHAEAKALRRTLQIDYDHALATFNQLKEDLLARRNLPQVVIGLLNLAPIQRTFPELPTFHQRATAMVRSDELTQVAKQQQAQGQWEAALASLDQALALDPSNPQAQAERPKTEERLAGILSDQAATAERAGRHAEAVDKLRRGSTLMSRNPQQSASYAQRAESIISALAKRLQQAGLRSVQNQKPGLGWAQLRVSALLAPSGAAPLPDLEPHLRYPVEIRSDGDPASMQRLWPELEQGLSRFSGKGRVIIQDAKAGPSQAVLRIALRPIFLATRSGAVVQQTTRYVKRIETRQNQAYLDLQGVIAEKSVKLRELDAVLAQEGDVLRRLQGERRRLRARFEESNSVVTNHKQAIRNAESRLSELDSLVSRAERQVSTADWDLKQAEYQLAGARTPEQKRRAESDKREAERKLRDAEREREEARRGRNRLRRTLDELRIQEPSSDMANRAESELHRKNSEVDSQQRVVSDLEERRQRVANRYAEAEGELARTPPMIDVPIHADYSYVERHATRLARFYGEVTLQDARSGKVVQIPIEQTKSADSFERDEHRAHGVPDLYIAPQQLSFPSDEELIGDLIVQTSAKIVNDLEGPLGHHADRFMNAATGAQGADRLNLLVLAYHGQAQLGQAATTLPKITAEIRDGLGLDLANSQVDLAKLDGK